MENKNLYEDIFETYANILRGTDALTGTSLLFPLFDRDDRLPGIILEALKFFLIRDVCVVVVSYASENWSERVLDFFHQVSRTTGTGHQLNDICPFCQWIVSRDLSWPQWKESSFGCNSPWGTYWSMHFPCNRFMHLLHELVRPDTPSSKQSLQSCYPTIWKQLMFIFQTRTQLHVRTLGNSNLGTHLWIDQKQKHPSFSKAVLKVDKLGVQIWGPIRNEIQTRLKRSFVNHSTDGFRCILTTLPQFSFTSSLVNYAFQTEAKQFHFTCFTILISHGCTDCGICCRELST